MPLVKRRDSTAAATTSFRGCHRGRSVGTPRRNAAGHRCRQCTRCRPPCRSRRRNRAALAASRPRATIPRDCPGPHPVLLQCRAPLPRRTFWEVRAAAHQQRGPLHTRKRRSYPARIGHGGSLPPLKRRLWRLLGLAADSQTRCDQAHNPQHGGSQGTADTGEWHSPPIGGRVWKLTAR
jgi:hypothetical protein